MEGGESDVISWLGSVVGSETSWTNCCESDEGRMKEGAVMCEEGQGSWSVGQRVFDDLTLALEPCGKDQSQQAA